MSKELKRKNTRVPMNTPVTYAPLPQAYVPTDEALEALNPKGADYQISRLKDISEGGLMINTTSVLEPGSNILMRFTLPSDQKSSEIVAIGRVRHLNLPKKPDLEETIGMGIEFRQLSPKGSKAITNLIEKHCM